MRHEKHTPLGSRCGVVAVTRLRNQSSLYNSAIAMLKLVFIPFWKIRVVRVYAAHYGASKTWRGAPCLLHHVRTLSPLPLVCVVLP